MRTYKSFFHFQHSALDTLWRWGLASVICGALALFSRKSLLRQAGVQAIVWGAIDVALAYFGQRGAMSRIQSSETDGRDHARRFRAILLANALLDVGYILGGWALVRRADARRGRVGMGIGIVVQGLFLLIFDAVTAWRTTPWTRDR